MLGDGRVVQAGERSGGERLAQRAIVSHGVRAWSHSLSAYAHLQLPLHKLVVEPLLGQQFIVRSPLHDAALQSKK